MDTSAYDYDFLIKKYDQPVPRYTSYPTVPYWQKEPPTQAHWLTAVANNLRDDPALSLYIHLPFCENLCTYCGCNKRITKNHGVESKYIDALLAEWKIYALSFPVRPSIKELHLGGGTPTFFSPEELARLLKGIFKYADRSETYSYSFESHPESTTKGHLITLAAFGFDRISIGIQDFNQAILQLINRKQSFAKVASTVAEARAAGYTSINFDIIYGLPTQTPEDIIQTVEHIANFRPERIAFYSYAHVPWVSPSQRAYGTEDLPKGDQKRALYELGKMLLQDIGYHDIGLDHFALPHDDLYAAAITGKLHRNFMGYTPLHTRQTIALGCSAIGDSWDTYVQNEKKVAAYQDIVLEEGRLPIIKGHCLTKRDQMVRRHIHKLMCCQETSWFTSSAQGPALDRAIDQWLEMEAEGLVELDTFFLKVTTTGLPFLRNICLPLDDHYWATQPEKPIFSQSV